jgi:SAM-dependent methyltransferase
MIAVSRGEADRSLYDRIAAELSRKDVLPASRIARQHRLRQTLSLVDAPLGRILEVGCGAGFSAAYLRGQYLEYVGVDHSEKLVEFARQYHPQDNTVFCAADINLLKCEQPFDCAFMIGVLHHLEEPVKSLRHIKSLTRSGGWIVANEPQPGNPLVSLARGIRKRFDENYSTDQVEFSAGQLRKIFLDAGLSDIRIVPQGYLSTPLAEVALPLQRALTGVAELSCLLDRGLEAMIGNWGNRLSWNLIIAARA